jgi:cytoskeleton protein RodZ
VERQAEEVFSIDVGNAGGIDVQFQGKPLSSLGRSGEVIHFVLPQNAVP